MRGGGGILTNIWQGGPRRALDMEKIERADVWYGGGGVCQFISFFISPFELRDAEGFIEMEMRWRPLFLPLLLFERLFFPVAAVAGKRKKEWTD